MPSQFHTQKSQGNFFRNIYNFYLGVEYTLYSCFRYSSCLSLHTLLIYSMLLKYLLVLPLFLPSSLQSILTGSDLMTPHSDSLWCRLISSYLVIYTSSSRMWIFTMPRRVFRWLAVNFCLQLKTNGTSVLILWRNKGFRLGSANDVISFYMYLTTLLTNLNLSWVYPSYLSFLCDMPIFLSLFITSLRSYSSFSIIDLANTLWIISISDCSKSKGKESSSELEAQSKMLSSLYSGLLFPSQSSLIFISYSSTSLVRWKGSFCFPYWGFRIRFIFKGYSVSEGDPEARYKNEILSCDYQVPVD